MDCGADARATSGGSGLLFFRTALKLARSPKGHEHKQARQRAVTRFACGIGAKSLFG
jgi:hypothetical protein